MKINWDGLLKHITREFPCELDSLHGPSHWRRVEENGLRIAAHSGAVVEVVRLFAAFHDSRREHDGPDHTHAELGAAYAAGLRGDLFDLPDEHLELLLYACAWHSHGRVSDNPTIGTCWDADRLDLGQAGIKPDERLMSTSYARELAAPELPSGNGRSLPA